MRDNLSDTAVCVDVGCHDGVLLRWMMRCAPQGRFLAFEPLPDYYAGLLRDFACEQVRVFNCALSDSEGRTGFRWVRSLKRPQNQRFQKGRNLSPAADWRARSGGENAKCQAGRGRGGSPSSPRCAGDGQRNHPGNSWHRHNNFAITARMDYLRVPE
jgi:hypothetical protein